jgi:hypothetical protein
VSAQLTPTERRDVDRARELLAALRAPDSGTLAAHIKAPAAEDAAGLAIVYGEAAGYAAGTIDDLLAIIDALTSGAPVTPDERVEIARDYLQGARQRDVKYLPPTRLMLEVAGTRHQLARVLAVIAGQRAVLTEAQLPVVLAALEDAAEWREQLAEEWAEKRGEYLGEAAAYRELARGLGGES